MPLRSARDTISEFVQLLAPEPGRIEFAIRLALICTLTVLVVEIYKDPEPALTAYVAFFAARVDRAESVITSVVLLVVITVVISVVMLLAIFVADDAMWRVVAMTLSSFVLLFLASASKLRPIGAIVALISGYGLDELGLLQVGELATRGYLYAWLFVGIPMAVTIVVNLLIGPPPRRLAERALAQRLDRAAAMLKTPDNKVRREFRACLGEGVVEIQKWLGLAAREQTSSPADIAALQQAANSTTALLATVDMMDRNPEAWLTIPLRDYLGRMLREMSAILRSGAYPIKIAWQPPSTERAFTPLEADIIADIEDAITGFAESSPPDPPKPEKPKQSDGFFMPDAFTNPEHVYYAIKTTLAAMFCYILYSLLDWPGIHTCFITVYIISLSTTAETVEKLTLRILGCLAGAAAGYGAIVFLLPYLNSIGTLMILVFVGALPAAYVAGCSPRISYAGFQFAFAFFLCVAQGSSPAFDLTIARDRVIGILLGNMIVFLLFTSLWPVSVGKRIDPAISALLRRLGALMTESNRQNRRALSSEAQSALAAIETDIELADYEPEGVRPNKDWLAARREAAHGLASLQASLLLSADRNAATSAGIAQRLERISERFAVVAPGQTGSGEIAAQTQWRTRPLFRIIDTGLRRLEAASIKA